MIDDKGQPIYCRDYEGGGPDMAPGCEGVACERYTMRFDDLGEPPLHWCASCGPRAHAMNAALEEAFATRGPEFPVQLEAAIAKAEAGKP